MKKKTIFDFSFLDIEGRETHLEALKGKSLLIVNVASRCGFTPQYQQLQELFDHYEDRLHIIAFPCNDFGGQEPEDEAHIKTFCVTNYNVGFILASKINIKKDPIHPIYHWLCNKSENGVMDSDVNWNFHKYLLDKNGQLIHVFKSGVSPLDERIIAALELESE